MDFSGNPYVGVYCTANEALCVVGPDVPPRAVRAIGEALQVRVVAMTVGGANVVGALLAMNAKGAILSGFATKEERSALGDMDVLVLPHRLNAAGNNVLCNDHGSVVHPGYDDRTVRMISETLGVETVRGTLAGMRTIGSTGVGTNKGVLAHPHATESELRVVQEVMKVPAKITTANYGTAQIGACLVANSKGAVVGTRTTPIEIDRIQDGLGLY